MHRKADVVQEDGVYSTEVAAALQVRPRSKYFPRLFSARQALMLFNTSLHAASDWNARRWRPRRHDQQQPAHFSYAGDLNDVYWDVVDERCDVLAVSNLCQHAQHSACSTPPPRALHAKLAAGGGMSGVTRFFKQAAARQRPWH